MERGIACIKGASAQVDIEVDGHLLAADASASAAGVAPSQYGLLLASLAACTALTLGQFAAARQWPLEALDVYLTLEREPDGMHIDRMLFVTGLDRQCQEELLHLAHQTPLTLILGRSMPINTILI